MHIFIVPICLTPAGHAWIESAAMQGCLNGQPYTGGAWDVEQE